MCSLGASVIPIAVVVVVDHDRDGNDEAEGEGPGIQGYVRDIHRYRDQYGEMAVDTPV